MKLHLPKMLLTAVLAACVAPTVLAAAPTSTTSDTILTGTTTTYEDATILIKNDAEETAITSDNVGTGSYIVIGKTDNGGRYTITSDVFAEGSTIIIAEGTYTDVNGNQATYTAGQFFVNMYVAGQGITIDNDIILGSHGAGSDGSFGAMRLHDATQNKKIVLAGDISLVQDATITVNNSYTYFEGNLSGDKTLTINGGGKLSLSGGADIGGIAGNVNIVLDAHKANNTDKAESLEYTFGSYTSSGTLTLWQYIDLTITGSIDTTAGITLHEGATLTIEGDNNKTGNIVLNNGAALTIEGDSNSTGNIELNSGAALTIEGSIVTTSAIRAKSGSSTFGDGTTSVNSSVGRLELCDSNGASASVAIKSGYTLKVTETDSTDFSDGAFILGEWGTNSNGTVDVEGTLIGANCSAMMGDGGGSINVKDGGTVAIQGIKVKANNTKLNLSVGGTGKLILGSDGIAASGATDSGKYSSSIAGTIGIMADSVSIDRDLTITGAAIFDTTKYAISDYTVAQNAETPAGGTLKLTGDLLLGTGTTGSVKLQGVGTMQLGAISSAVDINASSGTLDFLGTLSLSEGKKLTLGNDVSVTVSAGNLNAFTVVGQRIDEKGVISASGNGFIYGQHYLVSGGSLEGSATLSYDGQSYTIDNANRGFGEATIDCSIYSLTSGSAKVSEVSTYATAQDGTVSSYQLSAGTTLNVDTTTPATLAVNGNATLNITNGTTSTTTVNHSAVTIASGAKATMTGNGVYHIETNQIHAGKEATASPLNVEFDSDWTGQVNLVSNTQANAMSVQWLNLNHYGNENSTIRLKGVAGFLCLANTAGNSVTFASDLIMENNDKAALELSDGCTADEFIFSGNISNGKNANGSDNAGNFIKSSNVQQNFTFSGDISQWTGKIELVNGEEKNSKITTLTFTGSATQINNSIIQTRDFTKDGQLKVVKAKVRIDNTSAVTVANGIEHNNTAEGSELHLEVDTAKGTTFNKAVKVTDVTLDDASKAIFTKGLTADAMKLGKSAMLLTNTLSEMTLTAGAGSAVIETSEIPVSANSIRVTGAATMKAGGSEAGLGVNLVMVGGSTLEINGTEGVSLGGALTLGSGVSLGDNLKYSIESLNHGEKLVLFTNVSSLALPENSNPVAMLAGEGSAPVQADASTVFSELAANVYTITLDNSIVSINMLAVPEPTTATLSLLALAGLAARRRRK